jgi:signal transduction histidine kinase
MVMIAKWFLSVFMFLAMAVVAIPSLGAPVYRVLYINSYHVGFSWTDEVTNGVMSHFEGRDSFFITLEFMDAKRNEPAKVEQWFLPYLLKKYDNTSFDVVIVSDNSALDFVLKHQNQALFRHAPIVFAGISNVNEYPLEQLDIYGVVESNMFVSSFDVMRSVYPDFRDVYLFIDKTNTGEIYKREAIEFIAQFPEYKLYVKDSVFLDGIDTLMGSISGDAMVYYQGISVDGRGNLVDHYQVAKAIFNHAKVPVFTSYAVDVEGALGGQYQGGFDHGKLCAQLAEMRVKGIHISQRVNVPPMAGVYDYSKMQTYNFDVSKLPLNVTFTNRPESVWHKHKSVIIGNLLLIAFLCIVIFFLVSYNKTQKKARKVTEQAMAKALESDNLKGAFLANVSHELRTPLNAICGFAELLKTEEMPGEQQNYVDVIYNNSELLAMLVNDLLDISLIDANAVQINMDVTDLEQLFGLFKQQATSVIQVKNKQHLLLTVRTNPAYKHIKTDSFRVSQVMLNLINNAVKYTEQGGIEIGYDHAGAISEWLSVKSPGDAFLVFYVKDTGVGIEPEKQPMVFERFRSVDTKFVSQHGGIGLGLNIAKSMVELLGGEIFVVSEKGQGSVFGFFLPL